LHGDQAHLRAEKIADAFVAAFRKAANKIVVGDGLDPALTMGPMHSQVQLERGRHFVEDAQRRGANDTVYGLGGSIWSQDVERALKLATRMASGSVWIDAHGTAFINRRAPYGGVKQSGIGRKAGLEGILDDLQLQTISAFEKSPSRRPARVGARTDRRRCRDVRAARGGLQV